MAWKDADAFEAMAAYNQQGPGLNLSGGDRPEQVKGIHVSVDYFRVFGARFALGRSFTRDEDRPGGPRVAVVSYSLWHGRFGSDPAIVGRSIVLNDDPYTVVGVLAEGFRPDPPAEILIPLQPDPNTTNQGHYLAVAGRLKSGATIETAQAQLAVLPPTSSASAWPAGGWTRRRARARTCTRSRSSATLVRPFSSWPAQSGWSS